MAEARLHAQSTTPRGSIIQKRIDAGDGYNSNRKKNLKPETPISPPPNEQTTRYPVMVGRGAMLRTQSAHARSEW